MIKVTIELWPGGMPEKKRTLGEVFIANDGKGTATSGNYRYRLMKFGGKTIWKAGAIESFPRKRLGAYDLLFRVLADAVGMRNLPKMD